MPKSISDYNIGMRGVDKFDQLSTYYNIQLKSRRWYLKIFYQFLEIAMINSYVIYQKVYEKVNKPTLSHLKYRFEVIRGLINEIRIKAGVPTTETKDSKRKREDPKEEEESFENLDEEEGFSTNSYKRKISSGIVYKTDNTCLLEEIPFGSGDSRGRMYCQICKIEKKNNEGSDEKKQKSPQTNTWCRRCKIPVHYINCYDKHRSTIGEKKSKE